MAKSLKAEVAEKFEVTGLKEAGDFHHHLTGETSLDSINLKQANDLVVAGFPYLKPVAKK